MSSHLPCSFAALALKPTCGQPVHSSHAFGLEGEKALGIVGEYLREQFLKDEMQRMAMAEADSISVHSNSFRGRFAPTTMTGAGGVSSLARKGGRP